MKKNLLLIVFLSISFIIQGNESNTIIYTADTNPIAAFLGAFIVMGIFGLFSMFGKSDKEKIVKKIKVNPKEALPDIINVSSELFNTKPKEAIRWLDLAEIDLNQEINISNEELMLTYYIIYGKSLYNLDQTKGGLPYLEKCVEYLNKQEGNIIKSRKGLFGTVYFAYGLLLNDIGDKQNSEIYKDKASKLNKEYLNINYN